MRTYIISIIFGASLAFLHAQEPESNIALRFDSLPIRDKVISNLPKGREQEVSDGLVKWECFETLLRLNHGPTINRIVIAFNNAPGISRSSRGIIECSASPYIIDDIAPALSRNDSVKFRTYGEHAEFDFGESAQAAEIIGQLIIRAPEFSPEVKEWAKMHLGGPGPSIIQAGRAWWELNQAALLANQFDKVQVPASYPAGSMPDEPAQQLAALPSTIQPTPERTPEPIKSSVSVIDIHFVTGASEHCENKPDLVDRQFGNTGGRRGVRSAQEKD